VTAKNLTRLAAGAAPLLAAGALSAPAASASTTAPGSAADDGGYVLSVHTDPASTDYDNRRVDVTGTVTTADGAPAAGIPVTVDEVVLFTTWNPWGDPIDPHDYEPRELGVPVTDAGGHFTIPDVSIDHVGGSSLLNVEHDVQITASYDVDGDPDTPQDGYYTDTTVAATPEASTVTYHLNKKKVKAGDILTIDGKVTVPRGVEPEGTEIFLQTYWESESHVKTETEDDGTFVLSVRVRSQDDTFVLRTAPRDFYVAGSTVKLPVVNRSHP
jgi:hypothetical protein